jgi:hypothetical protein
MPFDSEYFFSNHVPKEDAMKIGYRSFFEKHPEAFLYSSVISVHMVTIGTSSRVGITSSVEAQDGKVLMMTEKAKLPATLKMDEVFDDLVTLLEDITEEPVEIFLSKDHLIAKVKKMISSEMFQKFAQRKS